MIAPINRNYRGWRIGESHQRAKLSDDQVRAMRKQRENRGRSYGWLSLRFKCPAPTVRDICTYRTRIDA